MIREAKRRDLEYKRFATADLAKYLSTFTSVNLFGQVKEIVQDGLAELNDDEEDDLQMKPMYANFVSVLTIVDSFYGQICIHFRHLHSNPPSTHREPKMPCGLSLCSTQKFQLQQSGLHVSLSAKPLKPLSINALLRPI